MYFTSSIEKHNLLKRYTANIGTFSKQDVFVLSSDSSDVLHPKAFDFPHMENLISHNDVLHVASLLMEEDHFCKAEGDAEVLVISLKDGVSSKKWVDTFDRQAAYTAVHSSQYRKLYNKAILIRNEALYSHYTLLSYIALFSFLGIIALASNVAFKMRTEMSALLLEGVNTFMLTLGFGFCLSKLAGFVCFSVCLLSLLLTPNLQVLFTLFIWSSVAAALSIFTSIALILLFKRRGIWAK
ncbi:MAG: hypothetical protein SP4CHLAM5_04520 [Chlamydiia bacterium]|nr:hypothetical protein [Chlamydiia bacterium]MCH9618325.1 hypothetical protein [Chlamydiia bacterium]MCH9624497.1 hypothetical protein [Chlamydiia bacterium]